jgi:hypothetical protein
LDMTVDFWIFRNHVSDLHRLWYMYFAGFVPTFFL